MNLNVEETGPLERRLEIRIPTAEVDRAFDVVFRDLRRKAHIRGFRPGRAPRPVIEAHFGDHARGEVLEALLRQTLFEAIREANLDIVAEPRVKSERPPKPGEAYAYEAMVEVRPVVELKQVEGLRVARPVLSEPAEDPVESDLRELRERHAQLVTEPPGMAAARGHVAVIDYEGRIEGEPFPGGTGHEVAVDVGAGRSLPGFEDALVGMTTGETREFSLTLPADHRNESLRGKTAIFRAELKELKRRELPELDDEFAKDVSELDGLEALRAELRRRFEARREQQRAQMLREAVIEAAVKANAFPLPPSLVHAHLHALLERLLSQFGPDLPQARREELTERWHEELHPRAERDTALAFLIPAIARAHEIAVSDEEIDAHLAEIAQREERSVSQVKRIFQERDGIAALRGGLLERKVVDFLVSKATLGEP